MEKVNKIQFLNLCSLLKCYDSKFLGLYNCHLFQPCPPLQTHLQFELYVNLSISMWIDKNTSE